MNFCTRCEHVWNVWSAVRLRGLDERRWSRCPDSGLTTSKPRLRRMPKFFSDTVTTGVDMDMAQILISGGTAGQMVLIVMLLGTLKLDETL